MNDTPITATYTEFAAWLDRHRSEMSHDLFGKAVRAKFTLEAMGHHEFQQSDAFQRAARKDLQAFIDAWASHIGDNRIHMDREAGTLIETELSPQPAAASLARSGS